MTKNSKFIRKFIIDYDETIKHLLDQGDYSAVHNELSDSINYLFILKNLDEVVLSIPYGIGFIAYVKMLHEETECGNLPNPETIRGLETFMAQTKLSLIKKNSISDTL